jgi:hypothetical protein
MIIVTLHVRPASQPCITSVILGRPRLDVLSKTWPVETAYFCFAITNTNTTLSVGIATRYGLDGPGFESR